MKIRNSTPGLAALTFILFLLCGIYYHPFATETKYTLQKVGKLLENEIDKKRTIPHDFNSLRVLLKKRGIGYFDAFGQRLFYLALSRNNFILKSFGQDGITNTLKDPPDPHYGNFTIGSLRYKAQEAAVTYPATLLMGSRGPNNLAARLFVNTEIKKKHLIVADKKFTRLMVSRHDNVEEFLWVPGKDQIVYTATNMERYQDGIFLWDLKSGQTTNLLKKFSDKSNWFDGKSSQDYYLSIYAIKRNILSAYILAIKDNSLNPAQFFNNKNDFQITLPNEKSQTSIAKHRSKPSPLWQSSSRPTLSKVSVESAVGIQKKWLALPMQGDIEEVIDQWQSFLISHPDSPIFSYALWWLILIYNDAYKTLILANSPQQDIIRSYGAELSKALANLTVAPSYLQAMGSYLYLQLITGRPPGFSVSDLTFSPSLEIDLDDIPPRIAIDKIP